MAACGVEGGGGVPSCPEEKQRLNEFRWREREIGRDVENLPSHMIGWAARMANFDHVNLITS